VYLVRDLIRGVPLVRSPMPTINDLHAHPLPPRSTWAMRRTRRWKRKREGGHTVRSHACHAINPNLTARPRKMMGASGVCFILRKCGSWVCFGFILLSLLASLVLRCVSLVNYRPSTQLWANSSPEKR